MSSETATSERSSRLLSDDEAWEAVKRRRSIGHVVDGVIERIETFGAFVDVGERFPAFIDAVDLPEEGFRSGDHCFVKFLQFADWNHQIRAAIATNEEAFVASLAPIDRAAAARLEGEVLKLRDLYLSWDETDRARMRHGIEEAANAERQFRELPGGFHVRISFGEDFYDSAGQVTYSYGGGPFSPGILLQAIEAWDRSEDFTPTSLWKVIAKSISDSRTSG